jgi:Co/Zn/Cd efflux system component
VAIAATGHSHDGEYGHSHGLVHASIKRSKAELRAVSLSLVVLLVTAVAQLAVFVAISSAALLADLIHKFGDALTTVPLGAAFLLRSFRRRCAPATSSWPRFSSGRVSRRSRRSTGC